jgi:hypothetical protein
VVSIRRSIITREEETCKMASKAQRRRDNMRERFIKKKGLSTLHTSLLKRRNNQKLGQLKEHFWCLSLMMMKRKKLNKRGKEDKRILQ